jgi:hypothetical protein
VIKTASLASRDRIETSAESGTVKTKLLIGVPIMLGVPVLLSSSVFLAQAGDVAVNFRLSGIIALLAGILILILPRILNYIVAFYLIVIGLVQVFGLRV